MSEYKKGDYVHYATSGICFIEDISKLDYSGSDTEFYILKPIAEKSSTVYVPVENSEMTSKMRRALSKSEIDEIIFHSPDKTIEWQRDRKFRGSIFKEIIKTGECEELLRMISCILREKLRLEEEGKKLSSADESFLKTAEGLIDNEFSFALDIDENGVGGYIRAKIKNR